MLKMELNLNILLFFKVNLISTLSYSMVSKYKTLLISCRSEGRSKSAWLQLRITTLRKSKAKSKLSEEHTSNVFNLMFTIVLCHLKHKLGRLRAGLEV